MSGARHVPVMRGEPDPVRYVLWHAVMHRFEASLDFPSRRNPANLHLPAAGRNR